VLDIGGADEQVSHATDSRKYRHTLITTEKAYQLILDVDEYSKKIPSVPSEQRYELCDNNFSLVRG